MTMARVGLSCSLTSCVTTVVLFFCCCVVIVESGFQGNCSGLEGSVRLDSGVMENSTCGYVQGRVQMCLDATWKNLCDTNWTISDAQVTCRSLNYSTINVQNISKAQGATGGSNKGINCTGFEDKASDCRTVENICNSAISVVCYTSDAKARRNCEGDDSTTFSGSSNPTIPSTTSTTNLISSTPTQPNTSGTTMNTWGSGATETSSSDFFKPPTLYYIIGGIVAVLLTGILILVLFVVFCCRIRQKDISPEDGTRKEREENSLQKERFGEILERDDMTTMHHQLQQSAAQGPIYEAIQNESSSTHSQGSPRSEPLVQATNELYSMLNTSETYAQIEPHISQATPADPPPPIPDSYYQQLNHKASSLKRDVPSIKPFQAVNRTALAVAEGLADERDLTGHMNGGSSISLPRNMSYPSHHQPSKFSGSLKQAPSGQIQMSNSGNNDGYDQNIYQTLEPPPEYSQLEQLEEGSEVSTTAVCNNSRTRSAGGKEGNSPQLPAHYHRFDPSINPSGSDHLSAATHSSVHSSCDNSLSGSPETNRSNGGNLLMLSRVGGEQKVMNKYSDSPLPSRKESGSPQVNRSAKPEGQSDIDLQSDHGGDRSEMNTLV